MEIKEFKCLICQDVTTTLSNYINHCQKIHGEHFVFCPRCPSGHLRQNTSGPVDVRYNENSLKKHFHEVHDLKFKCQICNKIDFASNYRKHQLQHVQTLKVAYCVW